MRLNCTKSTSILRKTAARGARLQGQGDRYRVGEDIVCLVKVVGKVRWIKALIVAQTAELMG
jgi:hypothetical protein